MPGNASITKNYQAVSRRLHNAARQGMPEPHVNSSWDFHRGSAQARMLQHASRFFLQKNSMLVLH